MKKLIILCAAIISLASCVEKKNSFFVQISDPQLGFMNLSADYSPEAELFSKAIAR